MFPEEELHELRAAIAGLPAGWATHALIYTAQVRQAFYGQWDMRVNKRPDDNVEWLVTQPNEATVNLFRDAVVGNPWTDATQNVPAGGSTAHHSFVFTRLLRTFAQFKTDPSNILDAGIRGAV